MLGIWEAQHFALTFKKDQNRCVRQLRGPWEIVLRNTTLAFQRPLTFPTIAPVCECCFESTASDVSSVASGGVVYLLMFGSFVFRLADLSMRIGLLQLDSYRQVCHTKFDKKRQI